MEASYLLLIVSNHRKITKLLMITASQSTAKHWLTAGNRTYVFRLFSLTNFSWVNKLMAVTCFLCKCIHWFGFGGIDQRLLPGVTVTGAI